MKYILLICFILFSSLTEASDTSHPICAYLGQNLVATWKDRWQSGDPTPRWAQPQSFCPLLGTIISDPQNPGQRLCTYTYRVGFINTRGFGSGYEDGNVFTLENFNQEVCHKATFGIGLKVNFAGRIQPCYEEAYAAELSTATGIDCNNMGMDNNQPGQWTDNYGGRWTINQLNKSNLLNGILDTSGSISPTGRCGIWSFSGFIDGKGKMSILGTNQHTNNPQPQSCLDTFSFTGKVAQFEAVGTYKNGKKQKGRMIITRQSYPPGFTTPSAPLNVRPIGSCVRTPWE